MSNTTADSIFTPPSSLFAKLLACENLDVVCKPGARTASFNPTSRVLTLPSWRGFTNDAWQLFIAHEVGHALFTPGYAEHGDAGDAQMPGIFMKKLAAELGVSPGQLHLVLNILEDIRIERMIREKYRGLSGFFSRGYLELLNRGFFGFKSIAEAQANWSGKGSQKYKTLDRLNIYAKVGSLCSLTLTKPNDIRWYNAALAAKTFEDVVEIAKDIVRTINAQNESKPAKPKPTSKPQAPKMPEPAEDPNDHDYEGDDEAASPDIEEGEDDDPDAPPVADSSDETDDDIPEDEPNGDPEPGDGDHGEPEESESEESESEESEDSSEESAADDILEALNEALGSAGAGRSNTEEDEPEEPESLESDTSKAGSALLESTTGRYSEGPPVQTMSRDLGFMNRDNIKLDQTLVSWMI